MPVGAVRKLRVIGGVLPAHPVGARLRLLEAATLRLVTEPVLLRRRIPVRLCARRTRACLGGRRLVETVGRAVDRVVPSRGRLVGVTAADLVRCADRSVGVLRTSLLEHRRSGCTGDRTVGGLGAASAEAAFVLVTLDVAVVVAGALVVRVTPCQTRLLRTRGQIAVVATRAVAGESVAEVSLGVALFVVAAVVGVAGDVTHRAGRLPVTQIVHHRTIDRIIDRTSRGIRDAVGTTGRAGGRGGRRTNRCVGIVVTETVTVVVAVAQVEPAVAVVGNPLVVPNAGAVVVENSRSVVAVPSVVRRRTRAERTGCGGGAPAGAVVAVVALLLRDTIARTVRGAERVVAARAAAVGAETVPVGVDIGVDQVGLTVLIVVLTANGLGTGLLLRRRLLRLPCLGGGAVGLCPSARGFLSCLLGFLLALLDLQLLGRGLLAQLRGFLALLFLFLLAVQHRDDGDDDQDHDDGDDDPEDGVVHATLLPFGGRMGPPVGGSQPNVRGRSGCLCVLGCAGTV